MNWAKLDYRFSLGFYNFFRRLKEWLKPTKKVVAPKAILVGATVLLGDLLMQGPLLQALRKRYPHAHITLLVPKGWAQFAKCITGVDDALEADLNNGVWLRKFRYQHKGRWDLGVVPFVYSLIPLFYALHVVNILSFPDPKGRRGYQIHQCIEKPKKAEHMSRMLLQLLQESDSIYPAPHLKVLDELLPEVLQNQRYVVIHPGASLSTRHWPSERYVAVAKELIAHGYQIVLTGSAGEKYLSDAILSDLPMPSVINLVGKTNLVQLAKVLQGAVAVIGPDTGVLHMAKALAIPSVTLLGPTQREIYGLDFHFHDLSRARVLYISELACRDSQTIFKHVISGVANCRRRACLYQNIPCLLGLEVSAVLNALKEMTIL